MRRGIRRLVAAAVLVMSMYAIPAFAQTVGGSCSPYGPGQIVIIENNVAACNASSVWQNLVGVPIADASGSIEIGANALSSVTTGTYNTAVGNNTLVNISTGTNTTALGNGAMYGVSATPLTGGYNTALGTKALYEIQGAAAQNTAVGYDTGYYVTTGSYNTAVGSLAMQGISATPLTGYYNVAIGQNALNNIQGAATENTAVGNGALYSNTGSYNTALGYQAGYYVTSGNYNTALGVNAMLGISAAPLTGNYNTALGQAALNQIQGAAANNTTVGYISGHGITSGTDNTLIGYKSGYGVSGNYNIILGEDPSSAITSGSSNILIGNSLAKVTNTSSQQLDIGDAIFATLSNGYVGIGTGTTAPTTALQVNGITQGSGFVTTSDARIKTDITPIKNGLAGILALRGVTYAYRPPAEREIGKDLRLPLGQRQMGVIAQNVEQVFPEAVESMEATGIKTVNYNALIAPMIEAIKSQQEEINALIAVIALLCAGLAGAFIMHMRQAQGF